MVIIQKCFYFHSTYINTRSQFYLKINSHLNSCCTLYMYFTHSEKKLLKKLCSCSQAFRSQEIRVKKNLLCLKKLFFSPFLYKHYDIVHNYRKMCFFGHRNPSCLNPRTPFSLQIVLLQPPVPWTSIILFNAPPAQFSRQTNLMTCPSDPIGWAQQNTMEKWRF